MCQLYDLFNSLVMVCYVVHMLHSCSSGAFEVFCLYSLSVSVLFVVHLLYTVL